METSKVQATQVQQQHNPVAEVPLATAVAGADASTLTSANPSQEKSFFTTISDTVVGAASWVKGKIVSFFSYIRSLFCGVSEAAKAQELTKMNEMKTLVEKTRVDFLRERDADTSRGKDGLKKYWSLAFSALPQDLQDALIKEDLRDIYAGKPDSEKVVEERFNNPETKADRIAFIRDLVPSKYNDVSQAVYYADADQYIPSYLQHIASLIGNDIKALSEE